MTYFQEYYRKNRHRRLTEAIMYYHKNEKKLVSQRRKRWHLKKQSIKMAVLKHYCPRKIRCQCKGCPIRHPSLLTIDHKKPVGKKRPLSRFGQNLHIWIIAHNFPKGFQILCWSCNGAKSGNLRCPRFGKSIENHLG